VGAVRKRIARMGNQKSRERREPERELIRALAGNRRVVPAWIRELARIRLAEMTGKRRTDHDGKNK